MGVTNEELSICIKQGEVKYLQELWLKVEKFIKMKATSFYRRNKSLEISMDYDIDDLVQVGFVAVLKTIQAFDENMGCNFLTALAYRLKDVFRELAGFRKKDMFYKSDTLYRLVGEKQDVYLIDLLIDTSEDCIESIAVEAVYQVQLRQALDKSIGLLSKQQEEVIRLLYYEGLTRHETAKKCNRSYSTIGSIENSALRKMYVNRKETGLDKFYEEDPNNYLMVGAKGFSLTWTSAIESIVIEQDRLAKLALEKYRRPKGRQ